MFKIGHQKILHLESQFQSKFWPLYNWSGTAIRRNAIDIYLWGSNSGDALGTYEQCVNHFFPQLYQPARLPEFPYLTCLYRWNYTRGGIIPDHSNMIPYCIPCHGMAVSYHTIHTIPYTIPYQLPYHTIHTIPFIPYHTNYHTIHRDYHTIVIT